MHLSAIATCLKLTISHDSHIEPLCCTPHDTTHLPQVHDWLAEVLSEGSRLWVDPFVHTINGMKTLADTLGVSGKKRTYRSAWNVSVRRVKGEQDGLCVFIVRWTSL